MDGLAQLQSSSSELTAAIQVLVTHCQDNSGPARDGTSQPLVSPEDPSGVISAKQSILAAISRIQTLLSGPVDFVQQLASQVRFFINARICRH